MERHDLMCHTSGNMLCYYHDVKPIVYRVLKSYLDLEMIIKFIIM